MTDDELLDTFINTYQAGRGFASETLRRRTCSLKRWRRFLAPGGLADATSDDVEDWLSKLTSPATRRAYRADLISFYRWAVRRGAVAVDPMANVDGVKVPRTVPKPVPAEVIAEAHRIGSGRVQLALLLGALAGLRVSEIASLHTDDLQLDSNPPVLLVRQGKGGKDRVVPMHPMLVDRLRDLPSGWVFKSPHGRQHVAGGALGRTLAGVLTRAGGQRYTAHQLRHFFGTSAARWSGGDVVLVASLMGHSNPATTMGYIGWAPTEGAGVVAMIDPQLRDDDLTARRRLRVS